MEWVFSSACYQNNNSINFPVPINHHQVSRSCEPTHLLATDCTCIPPGDGQTLSVQNQANLYCLKQIHGGKSKGIARYSIKNNASLYLWSVRMGSGCRKLGSGGKWKRKKPTSLFFFFFWDWQAKWKRFILAGSSVNAEKTRAKVGWWRAGSGCWGEREQHVLQERMKQEADTLWQAREALAPHVTRSALWNVSALLLLYF